jgi:very-short-patch-repair endonuclease
MTPIERQLSRILRSMKIKFGVRSRVGGYELDFMVSKPRLDIEADGELFHSSPEDGDKRLRRDTWLESQGFEVLHLRGTHIMNESDFVRREVKRALDRAARRSVPIPPSDPDPAAAGAPRHPAVSAPSSLVAGLSR